MNSTSTTKTLSGRRYQMVFGLIAAIYSVYLFLVLANGFAQYLTDTSPTAAQNWKYFYYFTTQSNILVWLWLIVFAVATLGTGRLAAAANRLVTTGVVLGLALYMIVVFVVVACILNPFYTGAFEPVPSGGQLYEHVISPMLIVAIYLFYPLRGRASARTVLAWLSYLILYVILANVVGASTTFRDDGTRAYPYNFLNPFNYGSVFMYLLTILGLALACFLVGIGLVRMKRQFDASFRPVPAISLVPRTTPKWANSWDSPEPALVAERSFDTSDWFEVDRSNHVS